MERSTLSFKQCIMFTLTQPYDETGIQEYVAWIVMLLLVATGFRHARVVISFVLQRFYEWFIQNNPTA
jgi:hypothetical protein